MRTGENKRRKFRCWISRGMIFVIAAVLLGVSIPQAAMGNVDAADKEEIIAQSARTFVHPGMLHTAESFASMSANIEGKVQPAYDTWNALKTNGFSAADWKPRVTEKIIRGGADDNRGGFFVDIRRAYQTALVWKLGGSESHGEAACRILNAWSAKKPPVEGNADRFLAVGIYGYELANAAEIMRDHPDFDKEAMEEWLLDVFYPMADDFLTNHNGAHFGNYWANWDLCTTASMMAIGIFTDRVDIYEQALDYYKTGIGMGSLYNAMPYVYEEGLAQWQESGRDQGHSTLGISLCGAICEMAWNQGDDLYSLSDNRFLKAAEYVAKYNNNEDVPYNPYERYAGQKGNSEWGNEVSGASRGSVRPVYSLVYNHYVNRMGLSAPNLEKVLKNEDGSWKLELGQSNGDEFGWQTLTFAGTGKKSEAKKVQGAFPDGVYRIRSVHTGKSIVADEEGNITSARRGMKAAEWWKFENTGDGEYMITNTVTGQVLQTGATTYSYDTKYETGKRTGALNQRFAMIPNTAGDYRILSSINGFAVSLKDNKAEDTTPVMQWKHNMGAGQNWMIETKADAKKADKWVQADFDFDDETSGFECETAKASGGHTLVESRSAEHGKAVYLDGSQGQFLTITDSAGGSFLAGVKELTISMEVKPDRTETNWLFYAAPDASAQRSGYEHYIGVLQNNGTITAERYNNNGKRPASPSAQAGSDWGREDVVMSQAGIEIYIDGKKAAYESSWNAIDNILGDSGILQIGKANWGDGEFYKGWIDNLTIRTIALSDEDVAKLAAGEVIRDPDITLDPEPQPPTPVKLPYVDVAKDAWYYDAVAYNYSKKTMTGLDDTHFGPSGTLVRSQFAAVLHKMNGKPVMDYKALFSDVTKGDWFKDAVLWAAEKKIVTGYTGTGLFGANDPVTRAQMATMMYRYAKDYKEYDIKAGGDYSTFPDAGDVQEFAKDAMKWAVSEGIITGKTINGQRLLDPQGSANRAECATIIQRFMQKYEVGEK